MNFMSIYANIYNWTRLIMTLEIILILFTIILAIYFLVRPTSKKEKERFEDKDNWRGGF